MDENYLDVLDLKLVAGRNFKVDRALDRDDALVINETAAAFFGWNPQEAIGKRIDSPSKYPAGEVIGVVKDYHQRGLQEKIGPVVMDYNPQRSDLYMVKYKAADTQELIQQLSDLWKATFPGFDFNYFFLDQNFEKQYNEERKLANVFALFAIVTIVIASIGLLGLVSFLVVTRTKEIGVRKVLGANVASVVGLLSKEFVMLVIVAHVVALPMAWYFSNQWLEHFAFRMSVSPLLFVWTFLIAIAITLVTVSYQTIRAAMADPVKALRHE
jgi:putative ABC transport system permease protein